MKLLRVSAGSLVALACGILAQSAAADIFQWELINPADPSQGRRQSATLAPDGAGRAAAPGAALFRADLTQAWLAGAELAGADLQEAWLVDADLTNANLTGARLRRALLGGAFLDGAIVAGADLFDTVRRGLTQQQFYTTASYQTGQLGGVNLGGNDLSGWDFSDANLTGADVRALLGGADFTGAEIRQARFGANLTEAQLRSTASFHAGDLRGVDLSRVNATGWDLSGLVLRGVDLQGAVLTGTNFTNADIRGAKFARFVSPDDGSNLQADQLYSTASYQQQDLEGVTLRRMDMAGWDFSGQRLVDANFFASSLAGAPLVDAEIDGAFFGRVHDLTPDQVYSTASYQRGSLRGVQFVESNVTGWDFSNIDLRGADFSVSVLTDADFTGADIRDAFFHFPESSSRTGLTQTQLYSTKSYQDGDLSGAAIGTVDMTGWNFAGFDLAGADFTGYDDGPYTLIAGTDLRGANLHNWTVDFATFDNPLLRHADLRGAFIGFQADDFVAPNDGVLPDGTVGVLEATAGETLRLWDYNDETPTPIEVTQRLAVDPGGEFRLVFEDETWGSLVQFAPNVVVDLSGKLRLEIEPREGVDLAKLIGVTFQLFDWTNATPIGGFEEIVTQTGYLWDTSQLMVTGEVTLLAVPEPAVAALVTMTLLATVTRRRPPTAGWRSPRSGCRSRRRAA